MHAAYARRYLGYAATPAGKARHAFFANAARAAGQNVGPEVRLVTCQASSSLGGVMAQMVEAAVHRVYVTDAEGAPTAVVTPTDILKLLAGA